MIKKKSFTAAFTLIELLVVITIIGILASVALPVFNTVQVKGQQTKSLAQAKQIGLALKILAGDNDGVYPKMGVPAIAITAPTDANQAFATLFPTYTTSEKIFGNKLAVGYQTGSGPDDRIDNPAVFANTNTLAKGENVYGYMMGLTDASSPSCPIVFDGPTPGSTIGAYSTTQTAPGGVWTGSKAVVIYLDNHGSVENLNSTSHTLKGINSNTGASMDVMDVGSNPNLTGCLMLFPKQ